MVHHEIFSQLCHKNSLVSVVAGNTLSITHVGVISSSAGRSAGSGGAKHYFNTRSFSLEA